MPGIKAKRKQLVRKTLMRAKAQGERAAEQRQESPEEYAQTEVQQGISDVAARTGNTAKSTTRISYRKFRAMQEKRKNLTLQGSAQSASKPTEKEKVTVPTQTERREMFKKQRFRHVRLQKVRHRNQVQWHIRVLCLVSLFSARRQWLKSEVWWGRQSGRCNTP